MGRPDARKTKDEAAGHVARGRWKKALECYRLLEKLEPQDGVWPQRVGEMHRRLGQSAEASDALGRAADIYSDQGFLLKAIAVCKLILEVEPKRADVEARLAALHAARFATQRKAHVMTAVDAPAPVSAELPAPPAPALAEVHLAKVVPGARQSDQIPSRPGSAVYEIPVAEERPLEPPDAADTARALLPRTPLFSALDEEQLRLLIQKVELRRLDAGATLFRRGDAADALYVVAAGEVVVLGPGAGGAGDVEIRRLGEGAFFGEIALLCDEPRTATIVASADTDLLVIDRATVSAVTAGAPAVLQVLLRFVRDRLVDSLVDHHALFTPFSGEDRRALAARFAVLEAEPGSTLAEQGQRIDGLFVVLAGQVDVVRDGRPVAVLQSGAVLGESSLLTRAPSPVTARARGKVLLLGMPRADVQELIMTHPQVLEQLGTLAEDRERELELWKQV